jgi:uncharacterized protein (TIGR02588 family)
MTKKTTIFFVCVAILALMLSMFATQVKPAKAAEQITIVNHQGILDSTGYYNVYGEVKNTGDTAAKNVYVKITFSSSSGPDEDETETLIHNILPGRKAPFMATASEQGSLVTSYTVELMDLTMSSEDVPKALEIVSATSETNIINNMMITGTVKNTGTETATYTRVYATVYDGPSGTGNVVAVTSCTSQPYNIDPGQTGNFQMGFFVTSGKSYVSMILAAESDQYEATTEYTLAIGQASTTTPAPTGLTSIATPAPTSQTSTTTTPTPTGLTSTTAPFSLDTVTLAVILVIVAVVVVVVAVAVKRKHH